MEVSERELMLYVIDFTLFIIIYLLFFRKRWWEKGLKLFLLQSILYTYICLVIMVTLMPFGIIDFIPGGNHLFLESANLHPYRDIKAGYLGAVRESILNVMMLLPFGFLLPFIKKTNVFKVIGLSFVFSLSIECMQLYFVWGSGFGTRSFDVTDIINNTIGGLLGYWMFTWFVSIMPGQRMTNR